MIDNEEFDVSNEYKEEELGEAVHYGDLGQSRWETRHSFMSGDRNTGGFGTGVYFLSKKLDYNWENRPTHEVDISKYNLYKPKDYDHAKLLHDTLRDICNYDAGGPNIRKSNSEMGSDIEFSDYWWYTNIYDGNEIDKDIYSFALQLNRAFNYRYDTNELARIIKREMKDEKDNVSLATHILQDLGWNGVNVTDIPEMDNPTYGSVVFNLDESLGDEFRLPKKLAHYGLHRYFSGDAIIFARAFKDKEKAKNIVSVSKNECGIPARLIPQKDKFCVYICRKGFPKGFEGWKNIEGLKEELEEKKDDHAPDAVAYFGTTNDMTIAGYLTKDGQFISLGKEGYLRGDDHRVISAVYDDDEVFDSGGEYLIDFMNEGNIRLIPEQPGIDLIKEPTQQQYSSLYKFIYYFWSHIDPRKDSFIFNVSDNRGYDIGYKEFSFSENTPTKILNGIKDYYAGNLKLNEDFIDNSNKEYLLEKTRNELITKSKRGDRYKDQSKGKNRWERRTKSSIANTVDNYNKIDMDNLWKKDILDVGINVKGETDDYVVRIKLKGVIKELAKEVEANHQNYEFKCVYRAIQTVMNSDNVWVSCSCLHPNTKVKLLDGTTPTVEEMKARFDNGEKLWVYSTDEKGDFKPGEVEGVYITKTTNEFIKVTLDNGEEILTTPDHLYMTRGGEYKPAEELKVGESLMPMYFNQTNGYQTVKFNTEKCGWHSIKIQLTKIQTILYTLVQMGLDLTEKNYEYCRLNSFQNKGNGYPSINKVNLYFGSLDEAVSYFNLNHKVEKIERVFLEDTPVYDIKVKDWHNFVVDAGVVLHNCPDFYFTFSYVSTKDDYNSGEPQSIPADIKNPSDTKGAGCKHINLVLGNIRWIMKVCSVINNYVHYMKRVKPQLFADYIFPKIFNMPYNRAVQLDLFGDQELKSDTETISLANEYNRKLNQFKNPDEYQYYDTKDTMGQRKNPMPEKPTEQEPSEEQHESLQLHEDTKEKTISIKQLEELAKADNQEYKFFEKVNGLANKWKEKGNYYSYWVLQDGTILECINCHCSIECWIAQNFIINGYEVEDIADTRPIQEEVERLYDYDLKEWNKGTHSNLSREDFLEYAFTYCLDDGEYYAARNWGAIRITVAEGILARGTSSLVENFHIQVPDDFTMTSAQLSSTKKLLKEFVDNATLRCRVTLCSVFNQHEKRFLDFTDPDKTIDNVIQNLQVFNGSHMFRNESVDEQLSEELYKNVYHGTRVDFDKFDAYYIDWVMGGIAGFWFTSDKGYATDLGLIGREYGAKILIEADLLINHPIYLDINDEDKTPLTIKKENVKRFIKEVIKPKFRYTEEELDGYVNALYEDDVVTDHNILTNLLKDFDAGNEEEVLDNIYDYLGVDGYIIQNDDPDETTYVVFSDSQILNRNKIDIEEKLEESKQDTNNFISWFGQDLTDRFLAVRQRLKSPENDFYYWKDKSKDELADFLTQVETTKSNTEQRKQNKEGADLLYNKDGWKVYKINTYDAAKYYGKGTKWCISGNYSGHEDEGEKYFKAYMNKGVVGYYFIFSPDNHKWCYLVYDIYPRGWPLWDEKDTGSDVPVKYDKSGETTIIRFPPEVYQALPNASKETIEDATVYAVKNYGYLDKLYKWDETTGTLTLLKKPKEWTNFSSDTTYDIYGELQKKMVDLGLLGSAKNKEITTLTIECDSVPFALFSGTIIRKINFPPSIYLEANSFNEVKGLESVTFVDGKFIYLCGDAFAHCDSLKSINIKASDTCVLNGAFRGCKSLSTINIETKNLIIEDPPFKQCDNIKQINLSATQISLFKTEYFVSYKDDNLIDFYFHLPDLKTPDYLDTGFYMFLSRHSKDNKFNDNIHITTDVKEAYIGKSMSVRAKQAYDKGEKPMSKWTKQEILDTIKDLFPDLTEEQLNTLQQMSLQDLKHEFLTRSSWHHTGKFYNATDFYSIDENAIEEFFAPNQPTDEEEVDLTTVPYYEFVIYINAPYKPLGYDVVYVRTTHEEWNFGKTYEKIKSEAIEQLRRYKKSQGILYILDSSHQVIEEIKADSLKDEKE